MTMTDSAQSEVMVEMIEEIQEAARAPETRVSKLIDALGRNSVIPVLMLPALAVVSPLSGVPGFSSLAGITIALLSLQLLIGRRSLWLPAWILSREVPSSWVERLTGSLERPARWFDRHTRPRLTFLAAAPFDRVIYAACAFCGLTMPFMEVLPLTSSLMASAVVLMSLTLLVRDGLFAIAGYGLILSLATAAFVFLT